ncbi:MAG TPA: tetratricopeptide repeat protein, partial [Polyangiales bacterium]
MRPTEHQLLPYLVACCICALAAAAGCSSDKAGASLSVAAPAGSSGGEAADAMTGMARPVPKTDAPSPTAAPTDKAAAPTQGKTVAQPVVPKLISVSADNKQPLGPSQWGAAAADTGTPLPKRTAPNQAAADAQKQGVAALLAGQLPVARQAFQRAVSADAKAYEANYDLGVVSDREGKPDEALQHYAAALRIQPDYELAVQG